MLPLKIIIKGIFGPFDNFLDPLFFEFVILIFFTPSYRPATSGCRQATLSRCSMTPSRHRANPGRRPATPGHHVGIVRSFFQGVVRLSSGDFRLLSGSCQVVWELSGGCLVVVRGLPFVIRDLSSCYMGVVNLSNRNFWLLSGSCLGVVPSSSGSCWMTLVVLEPPGCHLGVVRTSSGSCPGIIQELSDISWLLSGNCLVILCELSGRHPVIPDCCPGVVWELSSNS